MKLLRLVSRITRSFSTGNGLCGLKYLQQPKDFQKLDIAATNPSETLLILDQISNELCKVLDTAEFVRAVHADEGFQRAAQEAFEEMCDFMHELNCDTMLYKRLDEIVHNKALWSPTADSAAQRANSAQDRGALLSEEERVFALDLHQEYINEGIHLAETPGAQDALGELKASISALETEFMSNINAPLDPSDPGWFPVGPFGDSPEDRANYRQLRTYLENVGLPQPPEGLAGEPAFLQAVPIKQVLNSLLALAASTEVRRGLYLRLYQHPAGNAPVLSRLVSERHRLARFTGHASFADKYLENKILSTPDQVMAFIRSFSADIRPQAERELDMLAQFAHDSGHTRSASTGAVASAVNIWDVNPTIRRARASERQFGSDGGIVSLPGAAARSAESRSAMQRVSGFLHYERCLCSLEMICAELFDVQMKRVPLGAREGWEEAGAVAKYELVADGGRGAPLGVMYFDLFPRPGKFSNSAHFTVQCGCSNSDPAPLLASFPTPKSPTIMNWLAGDSGSSTSSRNSSSASGVGYQLPAVVLVLNLSGEHLRLDELETLYHEFGHALHSLLSRTTFQHLSGTRGSTDFVEVPSHLFEYFARAPCVLSSWAQNEDGALLPRGLAEEALARAGLFDSLELQTQLLFSAADQFFHGREMADIAAASEGKSEGLYSHMLEGVCRSQQELTVLPLALIREAPDTAMSTLPGMFPLSLGHLVNYSGGYYSYLFARQWAAQIWCNRFQEKPLCREAGRYLWQNMLRFGASKNKLDMLQDLGSRPGAPPESLSTHYYLQSKRTLS